METIRNYLESMFARLPNTPEVEKAKRELFQMMEDKYNELVGGGMSDNAAVGTVISEFGNLDELAEDLGIHNLMEESEHEERRMITLEEAKEYLVSAKKQAFQIALGVALCILSVVGPIVSDLVDMQGVNDRQVWMADGFGSSLMFILIAAGVVLFIYSTAMMKKWEFVEKEAWSLSVGTSDYVKQEEAAFTPKYALMLSIGVALCIVSFVPVAFMEDMGDALDISMDFGDLGGALMFILVAVGVFLIVYAANTKGSFEKLFKTADGKVYTPSKDENEGKSYISPSAEFVMEVFWPTVTCIYMCWSFLTFDWFITWIIWPIAAVLHAVLKSILLKRV